MPAFQVVLLEATVHSAECLEAVWLGAVVEEAQQSGMTVPAYIQVLTNGVSNLSSRPLDPAIVAGEKDSRYANGGLQSKTRSKAKAKVEIQSNVVKMTPAAPRGGAGLPRGGGTRRVVQDRPWPPAALSHLSQSPASSPKLASPTAFMAAAVQQLPKKKEAAPKPTVAQPSNNQSTVAKPAKTEQPKLPEITTIKQVARDELRGSVSPSSLTEGKPSPVSPSPVENEDEATVNVKAVGLGISGVGLGGHTSKPSDDKPLPKKTTIELEIAILRKFLEMKDVAGLIKFLEGQVMPPPGGRRGITTTAQTKPGWAASGWAAAPQQRMNPFAAKEPVIAGPGVLQPPAAPKLKSKPKRQCPVSSGKSKGLSDSKWATPGLALAREAQVTRALMPRSTNSIPHNVAKSDSSEILGDIRNVSRLTENEAECRFKIEAGQDPTIKKPAGIHRVRAGPGFQQLVKEVEAMKLKEAKATKAKKTTSEVNEALSVTRSLVFQYTGGQTVNGNGDGNGKAEESDESEL